MTPLITNYSLIGLFYVTSDEPTAPIMHSARLVSGPAPFLERIGTRSQDSTNEVSFAEKVTRFHTNIHLVSTNSLRSLVEKVQLECPASCEAS